MSCSAASQETRTPKPAKAHQGHDEAHGHLQEHEGDQDDKPVDARFRGRHGASPFLTCRRASRKSTSAEHAAPCGEAEDEGPRRDPQGEGNLAALMQVHGVDLALPGEQAEQNSRQEVSVPSMTCPRPCGQAVDENLHGDVAPLDGGTGHAKETITAPK